MPYKFNPFTGTFDDSTTGPAGTVSAAGSGTAALPGIAFASDLNTGIYNPGADQLAVATNGAQRLIIDANGNTHVIAVDGQLSLSKTGLRQYQLRVTGTGATEGLAIRDESGSTEIARFTQGGYLTVGGLRFKGTDTQNSIYQAAAFGISSDNYITVGTGATQTERLRVTATGLVGIGTSSVAQTLHVNSPTTYEGILVNGNAAPSVCFDSSSNTAVKWRVGLSGGNVNNFCISQAGNNDKLVIDSAGRVGIGTTTFAGNGQLEIQQGTGTSGITINSASETSVLYLRGATGGFGGSINSNNVLIFSPANTERARLDTSGRLLVGTSTARQSNFGGSGFEAQINFVGTTIFTATTMLARDSNDNAGYNLYFGKTRNATPPGAFVNVALNDELGQITFGGANEGIYRPGAQITALVDGEPSTAGDTTDMPGRLVFSTTADGAASPTERLRINSAGQTMVNSAGSAAAPVISKVDDTNTGIFFPAADTIAFAEGGTEVARLDSSGRLLVGTSSATNHLRVDQKLTVVVAGTSGTNYGGIGLASYPGASAAAAPVIDFNKSRGSADGTMTVVASNDVLGYVVFRGADGTSFIDSASITGAVDGTPGSNDMPGRLVFSTAADGSASPTERLRITSAGVLQVADAGNITVGTTTGTKIGTATTQKLGFYNATPVVQPAAVADATDAASVIARLNDLLARLRTLGIIAT